MPLPTPAARVSRALILLSCAALWGCGPRARSASHGPADQTLRTTNGDDGAQAGYLPPPRLVSVVRSPTAVMLMGSAAPNARVELMAPEGDVMADQANSAGAWRLALPAVTRPRMFALEARVKDGGPSARLLHSEGALILLPHAGLPALLVRAGAGALVFAARTVGPSLDALDYDPGGFYAVAGRARPGASVRLTMDGALAGVGQADAEGRYSILAANRRLSFGIHSALVQSAEGQDEQSFTISAPGPPLTSSPYEVDPRPNGWRLEWAIPDGAVQTTLVFIPAG